MPLIGEQGWAEDGAPLGHRPARPRVARLPQMIAEAAEALPDLDDPAFGDMFDRFADRRVVLLGEASHGTSEFYRARAAITRRLVEQHGFTIVAVEADWPDAAGDRPLRPRPARPRERAEPPFQRFPTWMWRNTDVAEFHRAGCARTMKASSADRRAGFYGLDIYNMSGSIAAVLAYLDGVDPEAAAVARERYGCLTPWQNEPSTYGRAVLSAGYRKCEEAVVDQCRELLAKPARLCGADGESFLDAAQNARLVAVGRALLPDHVLRRRGELEPARHAHVRDARASARGARAGCEGGGLGAQLPYRRRAPDRNGQSCATN